MTANPRRLRVLVCGTTFGQAYLNGLAAAPAHFELAGILARGGPFARACAESRGVPFYTGVEQLPDGIDVQNRPVTIGSMPRPDLVGDMPMTICR